MPHINVDKNLPGIRALLGFKPTTAAPKLHYADTKNSMSFCVKYRLQIAFSRSRR